VLLQDSARTYPERTAVVFGEQRLTYAQVDKAAGRVASLLAGRGIRPGDRVALSCPNVPYFPAVYYGILRAGAVVVPMNVLLKGREVAYYLSDSGAKLIFAWHGFLDAADQGAQQAGDVKVVPVEPGKIEGLIFAHEPDADVAER